MQITAELLRNTRNRLGETQAVFAKRFACDQATIHRWETDGPPQSGLSAKAIGMVMAEIEAESPPSAPDGQEPTPETESTG